MKRLALAALALALGGAGCKKTTDEDLVRAVIERAITAANEKKAGSVLSEITSDFKGPKDADEAQCRRILLGYFLREQWVRVFTKSVNVEVEGETAKGELDAIVARGNPVESIEDLVPTNGTHLIFNFEFVKQDGDWKFKRATARQVRGL